MTYAKTAKAVWFRMSLSGEDGPAAQAGRDDTASSAAAGDAGGAAAGTGPDAVSPAAVALRPDLGMLSYDELLRHTAETAMDATGAGNFDPRSTSNPPPRT